MSFFFFYLFGIYNLFRSVCWCNPFFFSLSIYHSLLFSWRRTSTIHVLGRSFSSDSQRNGNVSFFCLVICFLLLISFWFISRSWAVATNLFWAGVISVTFPRMLGAFGIQGTFGFYAGLNVCALAMIFFLMPGMDHFRIFYIFLYTHHSSFFFSLF